ncbi:MAG: hypothetical protein FWJ66_04590 [Caldibacillus sp.]
MAAQREEGKVRRKLLRMLAYIVIIPLLFALMFVFLYGLIFQVNIFDAAKDYLEKRDHVAELKGENEYFRERLAQVEAKLEQEKARNEQLQQQLEEKDLEIDELTRQIEEREQELDAEGRQEVRESENGQTLVNTFLEMKPKRAAPIIVQLEEEIALDILASLDEETLAEILENMPPEDAANYTAKLARNTRD